MVYCDYMLYIKNNELHIPGSSERSGVETESSTASMLTAIIKF